MAKLISRFLKWPWKQQTDKNNLKTSKMIEETLKSPKIPKYQPMTKILLNLQNNQNIFKTSTITKIPPKTNKMIKIWWLRIYIMSQIPKTKRCTLFLSKLICQILTYLHTLTCLIMFFASNILTLQISSCKRIYL